MMSNKELVSNLEAVRGMIEWDIPLDFIVALDEVVEMLKPKKPKKVQGTYRCCSCERKLRFGSGKKHNNRDKRCPDCGQVIDWRK